MSSLVPRNAAYVCRSCRSKRAAIPALLQHSQSAADVLTTKHNAQRQQTRTISSRTQSSKSSKIPPTISQKQKYAQTQPQPQTYARPTQPRNIEEDHVISTSTTEASAETHDIQGTLRDIQTQINTICGSQNLPDEVQVLEVMDRAYQFANVLVFGQTTAPDEEIIDAEEEDNNADNNIFSELDEPSQTSQDKKSPPTTASSVSISHRERSARKLSEILYTLLKDPKIMISQPILSTYVRIICQLGNPEFLPEIFFLYAHKPQPVPGSTPIQYRKTSPSHPKNAIPQELSDVALDTAILHRDLALAVAIIDTTVGTRAFRLGKLVRKASVPFAALATTPIAAYAAAEWVANWQNSLDPQMAKAITLMGTTAYVGTLTTVGFVALTTWNDHHERVRWTEGTPLRYRWMQEEERLYFDRIAMAWGFQRKRRRGEEMGGLWEELREECGVRGMVLDKSELLPGMQ